MKKYIRKPLMLLLLFITMSRQFIALKTDASDVQYLEEVKAVIRQDKTGKYGMIPVYACDVAEGTYQIQVESNSSFFKITHAELSVSDGKMTAKITISSLSYQYVFPGTQQDAEQTERSGWISGEETDGHSVFTIPVESLNHPVDCAAFSKKKKKWYDRQLVFYASSLPEEALKIKLPDYDLIEKAILAYQIAEDNIQNSDAEIISNQIQNLPEAVSIPYEDGEYSIEVNMTGGSGRASISSPTLLTVKDGRAFARLLWSSPYYDYMTVEDETYYNLTEDGGNSVFEIPITVMDTAMNVTADTTAMGEPVEIEYQLIFYPNTIGSKGQIPQEAAKKVLIIAFFIITAGGLLNYIVKKNQK